MPSTPDERRKSILFLTNELRPGGAEKCLVNLAYGIDQNQFQPRVVSIRSQPDGQQCRLVRQLADHRIPTDFLDCNSRWAGWKAIRKLKQLIQHHNPAIVQSFLFYANVLAGVALRSFPKIKLFTGIRVADPSRFRHRIEKLTTKQAQNIVAVSESVRKFAVSTMGLPADKLISIPNGVVAPAVDPEFDIDSLGISAPYVVFVGRLEPQKNLTEFLAALRTYQFETADFDLVFVGTGSQLETLKNMAKTISRPCHFLGWHPTPQDLIAKASVLVLPSKWEGLPNALLETMALRKCFVAFGVDGVRDLVSPDNFQIVQPGNYRQFFEKLTQLLNQPMLAEQLGIENQQRVASDFSIKKMIAEYERIYLNALPLLS